MRKSKYTKEQIERGRELWKIGWSKSDIMREVGFEDRKITSYHIDSDARRKQIELTRKWMKNNRERHRKTVKAYQKRRRQGHGA